MTTEDVESYADISGLASPDLNLKIILRREVVPMFLADVGAASWRRKSSTLTFVAGTKAYDLATDVQRVLVMNTPDGDAVKYSGEHDAAYLTIMANTADRGTPTDYCLVPKSAVTTFQYQANFYPIPYAAGTARYLYEWTIAWSDLSTKVELDPYIPAHYQWALVAGLQRRILFYRLGISDQRYVQANEDYNAWVSRAIENREGARRNYAVFAR